VQLSWPLSLLWSSRGSIADSRPVGSSARAGEKQVPDSASDARGGLTWVGSIARTIARPAHRKVQDPNLRPDG
jgi:hypothetical protein